MKTDKPSQLLTQAIKRVLLDASRHARTLSAVSLSFTAVLPNIAHAELPVACTGSCGNFVSSGAATATWNSNTLNVNQTSSNVTLNWQSFNVSADATVNFKQPDASSVALNRIYQADPSKIFGTLNANGRIYLLNQNGILFGSGARVNVGSLIASSLDFTPAALSQGIVGAADQGSAAFALFNGATAASTGDVKVEPGAVINTPSGGQVFMFAPNVVNQGTIHTPDGQTILAGGQSVYLTQSNDPQLHGLVVEVGIGGTVTNGDTAAGAAQQVGEIIAERGNVTLAGLAVNQYGRITATTSVNTNGSIRLLARDSAQVTTFNGTKLTAGNGGTLTLGENSVTQVTLDDSSETAVDSVAQLKSKIELDGNQVDVLGGSRIVAPGGQVAVTASKSTRFASAVSPDNLVENDQSTSRIYVAPDALIDVSGATANVAMERNSLRVELRGSQLADSPEQRDGPLRGQTVYVDVRQSGIRADGTTWQGTPLADVSGDIAGIGRDVRERNSVGGTISLQSTGDVILAPSSTLNVSGGAVDYSAGRVTTSQLMGTDGKIYDMANADPNRAYTGIVSTYTSQDLRWGVSKTYVLGGGSGVATSHYEAGYVEGKDAGSIQVLSTRAVLDSDMVGNTTAGVYQRLAPTALAVNQVFRPYNQLPLGASLTLGYPNASGTSTAGPDYISTDVEITHGLVLPTLVGANGSFDPLTDALPGSLPIRLRPELIGSGHIAKLAVASNESFTVEADAPLTLASGGSLDVTAAHADILASISAPSGEVNIAAGQTRTELLSAGVVPSIHVAGDVAIDTKGSWVNDNPLLSPTGTTSPLWIDGGSINLSASQGSMMLDPGSILDVSAGAWRKSSGAIAYGKAGSISLGGAALVTDTNQLMPNSLPFEMEAELFGYGFDSGGQLSIQANEVCIAATGCNSNVGTLWLTPDFFTKGGFSSYSLTSNIRGVDVAAGSQVVLKQINRVIDSNAALARTGSSLNSVSSLQWLPDYLRTPVNLSLRVNMTKRSDVAYDEANYTNPPNLHLGAGATISADPGAIVNLESNTSLIVDGNVRAPAGSINLTLDDNLKNTGYLSNQGIWLTNGASLDVGGVTVLTPNDLGLRVGNVLDGGSVTFDAQRGYVIVSPGSEINVSGTSAGLDISTSPTTYARKTVGSAGGSLNITAAEGAILGSEIKAGGGTANDYGGDFSLVLDAGSHLNQPAALGFPNNPREIVLAGNVVPTVVGAGSSLPDSLNGQALVDAQALIRAKFDSVSLTARNLLANEFDPINFGTVQVLAAYGHIQLASGLIFSTRARLSLDAAVIGVEGGLATLNSANVSIGNSDVSNNLGQVTPTLGTPTGGTLQVNGNFIDVVGRFVVSGADNVVLNSAGDIRLRGVLASSSDTQYSGALSVGRNLELDATQIYPTTLTDFTLQAGDTQSGTIVTKTNVGTSSPVLSAGGHLTLLAQTIDHGGVLRAPYGEIDFGTPAQPVSQLTLEPGSVVSTSAQTLIPFGTTQGGFDWVYGNGNQTIVYGTDGVAVPEQKVNLNADSVDFAAGAKIDVSAGSDMQAYEWVPGVGGTKDVLASSTLFAILPGSNPGVAPYDGASDYQNAGLRAGDSVYLSGVSGLAAGVYTLLPARYALLPGAYLVSAAAGYTDLTAGQKLTQLDGSQVVSGYRTISGTNIRDSRTSGFVVRPGSDALQLAQYNLTKASDFFTQQAIDANVSVPRLAQDAGSIAFIAGSSLNLAGTIVSKADSGRGAAVDISSDSLRVVQDTSQNSNGEVLLSASQLSGLQAESLLLGGQRTDTAAGTSVNVTAQTVAIDANTQLSGPEILLTAKDSVTVGDNATIKASGKVSDGGTLLLQGDSALLRVSAGRQVNVSRSGAAGTAGTLDVSDSAVLSAEGGSLTVDASMDAVALGTLQLDQGSLSVGTGHISFGPAGQPVTGLLLNSQQFAGLNLSELVLNSRSTFDFYGSANFNADNVVLNGAGLAAVGDGVNATLNANRVTLENTNGIVATPVAGNGRLTVNADQVQLGKGTVTLSGFADSRITGAAQIAAADNGALQAAGNLQLAAGRITGAAGKDYQFSAAGNLNVAAPATVSTTTLDVAALGSKLAFSGDSITVAGTIETLSGIVELNALGSGGNVEIASGGRIDAAGSLSNFDSVNVAADAGQIHLTSAAGDVRIDSGATLDLQAATGGQAGTLNVDASQGAATIEGTLLADADTVEQSGHLRVDAQSLQSLDTLTPVLESAGFRAERTLRQRGPGDLTLSTDWHVHELNLTADQGGIALTGNIDGGAQQAGSATLSARDNVSIAGTLNFSALGADNDGGHVELSSTQGGVLLNAGSVIDVSAGQAVQRADVKGGDVLLRLPRTSVNTVLDSDAGNDLLQVAGTIRGARAVTVEGYQTYGAAQLNVNADASNPLFADAQSFMAGAAAVQSALGHGADTTFSVAPGIEVDSSTGLTLNSDWDLSQWRFGTNGNTPGVLTLRSSGDLVFNGSLSDGFSGGANSNTLLPLGSGSWTYRLASGADLSSANALAVSGNGNFVLSAGNSAQKKVIRTGTGSIDIASGGSFTLGNQQSVIYTAGAAGPGVTLPLRPQQGGLGGLAYPTSGGDISIDVQGSIVGARSNQLYTNWLWRTGTDPTKSVSGANATAWTVSFANFEQGVGALGGGNVTVSAKGDITDLSVSAPSVGRQVGGTTPATSQVEVIDGGDITVNAGGDLLGGTYYAGLGNATLHADESIGVSTVTSLAPVLALGDATMKLAARTGVVIETAVNPTILPQSSVQTIPAFSTYFSTYTADAGVDITSLAGSVGLGVSDLSSLASQFNSIFKQGTANSDGLSIYPPSLHVAALSGDLSVAQNENIALFPAARANLELFADRNVLFSNNQLVQSDADPALLASPQRPDRSLTASLASVNSTLAHAGYPVHARNNQPDKLPDPNPVRVVARTGSVSGPSDTNSQSPLQFAKPARVVAGTDIVNLPVLHAQNLESTDVTSLIAGRDLIYTLARNQNGAIQPSMGEIDVAGPGKLDIQVGRNVNLGTSNGISTVGASNNPALPSEGASVSVVAGLGKVGLAIAQFTDNYLKASDLYDADLIAYMEQQSRQTALTKQQALDLFGQLPESAQLGLIQQVFFSELRTSGRYAAESDPVAHGDFSRGFAAVDALFPGSNPSELPATGNPYSGSILLYFSKIYTLFGGDIDLMSPGGEVNVGLATPPSSFNIDKGASDLGLVVRGTGDVNVFAYDDLQVNESRVFAADGGNILVWSSDGNIDAGRGAKTAISAPPPTLTVDPTTGQVTVQFSAALSGSGIQTLATSPGAKPGNVDLFAPRGVVNAGDAGIVAGNLTIAATAVLGANNIQVSGVSVGVPVDTGGLGASLAGAASAASGASNAASSVVQTGSEQKSQEAPVAQAALSWLDVFVVGLGEDACAQSDVECLKRQKQNANP